MIIYKFIHRACSDVPIYWTVTRFRKINNINFSGTLKLSGEMTFDN